MAGEHDVAVASAAAEAAVAGVAEATTATDAGNQAAAGVQTETTATQTEQAAKVEAQEPEIDLFKNRQAEYARKQKQADEAKARLDAEIAKRDGKKPAFQPVDVSKLEADEDGEVEYDGVLMSREQAERWAARDQALADHDQRFASQDVDGAQKAHEAAVAELESQFRSDLHSAADKVWPNRSDDDKQADSIILEGIAEKLFDEAAEQGKPLNAELMDEVGRQAIATYRGRLARLAQAQLTDAEKARTAQVKPDAGTAGTEAPDESTMTREQLARLQRERSEQAEAYANAHP